MLCRNLFLQNPCLKLSASLLLQIQPSSYFSLSSLQNNWKYIKNIIKWIISSKFYLFNINYCFSPIRRKKYGKNCKSKLTKTFVFCAFKSFAFERFANMWKNFWFFHGCKTKGLQKSLKILKNLWFLGVRKYFAFSKILRILGPSKSMISGPRKLCFLRQRNEAVEKC